MKKFKTLNDVNQKPKIDITSSAARTILSNLVEQMQKSSNYFLKSRKSNLILETTEKRHKPGNEFNFQVLKFLTPYCRSNLRFNIEKENCSRESVQSRGDWKYEHFD